MSAVLPTFCRLPENVTGQAGARFYQWPIGHVVTWTVVRDIPRFSASDYKDVADTCFKLWMEVCGWETRYVSNPSQANLLLGARAIDGALGVLAEAELPVGNITPASQLRLWMDLGEQFAVADNPPRGTVPIVPVLTHEIGHNAGLGHIPGQGAALMNPSISRIMRPQKLDSEQMVLRYGERRVATPPGTPDGGGGTTSDLGILLNWFVRSVRNMTPAEQTAIRRLLGIGQLEALGLIERSE